MYCRRRWIDRTASNQTSYQRPKRSGTPRLVERVRQKAFFFLSYLGGRQHGTRLSYWPVSLNQSIRRFAESKCRRRKQEQTVCQSRPSSTEANACRHINSPAPVQYLV